MKSLPYLFPALALLSLAPVDHSFAQTTQSRAREFMKTKIGFAAADFADTGVIQPDRGRIGYLSVDCRGPGNRRHRRYPESDP